MWQNMKLYIKSMFSWGFFFKFSCHVAALYSRFSHKCKNLFVFKRNRGEKQEFIQRKECWINFDVSEQALLSMCTCGLSIAE